MAYDDLKALLKKHGKTQKELAGQLRRSDGVISHLFSGLRKLEFDEAVLIAQWLGEPLSAIAGLKAPIPHGFSEPEGIPFQHAPTSQRPEFQHKEGRAYLHGIEPPAPHSFALEIRDDSMNLEGLLPGDIILSAINAAYAPGDIVIAQLYKGMGAETIVRLYRPPFLIPRSMNASHREIAADSPDVRIVAPVLRSLRFLKATAV